MSVYTSTQQPVNEHHHTSTVHEIWIFTMIGLGFMGFFILLLLIVIAIYKIDISMITKRKYILLQFLLWFCSAISCFEWAFFRTDLFFDVNITKCTIIYISNYLFYMLGKYCLHILLLYRLYLTFHGTTLQINTNFLRVFCSIITIDFIVFVALWLQICFGNINVGYIIPSEALNICTLYNNSSTSEMSTYERTWPLLFGLQDGLVGIATLVVFIYKLNQLTKHTRFHNQTDANEYDTTIEPLVRKLFILGIIAILSTFIMFTFAIPFYPNLTFLLPLDALINSLCVFLLLEWANSTYLRLCCVMDTCLKRIVKHRTSAKHRLHRIDLNGINGSNTYVSGGYVKDSPFTNTPNAYTLTPNTISNTKLSNNVSNTNVSNNVKLESENSKKRWKTYSSRLDKYIKPTLDRMQSYGEVENELNQTLVTVMNEPSKSHHSDLASNQCQVMVKSKSDGQTLCSSVNPLPLSESRFIKSSPLLHLI